jgi:hypothetical protein
LRGTGLARPASGVKKVPDERFEPPAELADRFLHGFRRVLRQIVDCFECNLASDVDAGRQPVLQKSILSAYLRSLSAKPIPATQQRDRP